MGVQVNLVFDSVDEAIVALGRMVAAKTAAPAAPAAEAKTRKGRSDAGQPRGAHKPAETPSTAVAPPVSTNVAAPVAQSNAAQTAATAAVTSAPAAAAPKAPAPSADDVQKAVEKLFNAKGFEDCAGVLSRFGVKRGKDLAEEQRADFIAKTERVIAGEAI